VNTDLYEYDHEHTLDANGSRAKLCNECTHHVMGRRKVFVLDLTKARAQEQGGKQS